MQKLAKILGYTFKEGVSGKTGEPYRINEVHVKWQEQPTGAQPYDQEMVMSVMGFINDTNIQHNIVMGTPVSITFYVGVRSWNDRKFTDIKGYLPKDMMEERQLIQPTQEVKPL